MRVLVVDTGYFMEIPLEIAWRGDAVFYHVEWRKDFPDIESWAPGYGFKDIVKIKDYMVEVDEADLIVFPDVGFGGVADYLRSKGYTVYGASYAGQLLELNREFMHRTAVELGIGRPRTAIAKGVDGIKAVFRYGDNGEKYVKISTWRGNMETLKVSSEKEVDALISGTRLGPLADDIEFIVEDKVGNGEKAVEIGADFFFNGREFVRPYLFSPEVKDTITVARWVNSSVLDEEFIDKIEGWLADTGYRGQISIEGFLTESGRFYLLDVTARQPFPAGGILCKSIENYSEVLYQIARGEDVRIVPRKEFGVEIVIGTENTKMWIPVHIDGGMDTVKQGITPKMMIYKDDVFWHIPAPTVAGAVGLGDSIEEAYRNAVAFVDKVHAQFLYDGRYGIEEFEKRKKLLEEMGYNVFSG